MMYHKVVPILDTDASKVIKVQEITCTEHQIQVSTLIVTGTISIQGKSVMAADYGEIDSIDLEDQPPVIKQFSGVYESIKIVPSTGMAMTVVLTSWSWF